MLGGLQCRCPSTWVVTIHGPLGHHLEEHQDEGDGCDDDDDDNDDDYDDDDDDDGNDDGGCSNAITQFQTLGFYQIRHLGTRVNDTHND